MYRKPGNVAHHPHQQDHGELPWMRTIIPDLQRRTPKKIILLRPLVERIVYSSEFTPKSWVLSVVTYLENECSYL